MHKPKMIICDIDSTLVVKHQTLTPRARACIEKLRSSGVYFGIASGRPLYQIREGYDMWGYDDFDLTIGMNGSVIWDNIDKKEYNYYVMKKEWLKETIELMAPFQTNPSVYRTDSQIFFKEDETLKLYAQFFKSKVEVAKSIEDLYSEETAKIMFRLENEEDMPKAEKWIAEHPNPNYIGFKTQPSLIEFCDKRVNKAYALKKFCEMHDIELKDIIAFGDTTNDNEMLTESGVGVCLKNGSDDTKAIADYITDKTCDDDGWADFTEKYIMPFIE